MSRKDEDRTAAEYARHREQIAEVVASWQRGEITVAAKRSTIAMLNARYYGEDTIGVTGVSLTSEPKVVDEVAYVFAEAQRYGNQVYTGGRRRKLRNAA